MCAFPNASAALGALQALWTVQADQGAVTAEVLSQFSIALSLQWDATQVGCATDGESCWACWLLQALLCRLEGMTACCARRPEALL